MLTVLDLFSGIGGFSLGLERTGGFKTIQFCEIDPFCRRVLAKHWPDVPCHDDVTTMQFREGMADVITGGFPCQDISYAGRGAGLAGERSGLYRHLVEAVRVVRPRYLIVENVTALLDRGLGVLLGDLAKIRYDAEWHCIRASAIGAEHERDRIVVVSYPNLQHGEAGLGLLSIHEETILKAYHCNRASVWLAATLPPPRVANGSTAWLDRRKRTEATGNAIVPQIATLIGEAILTHINSTGSPDCAEPCSARYRVRAAVPPQEGAAGCCSLTLPNARTAPASLAAGIQSVQRDC